MNIIISLRNNLICEALYELLRKDGYQILVASDRTTAENFRPDVILVDLNNINPKLFSQYPESKVILIDTGLKQEDIITTLVSYWFLIRYTVCFHPVQTFISLKRH